MRLFVGIKTQCEGYLVSLQQKLRGRGRLTHAANLHITLKFLGEVHESRLGRIRDVLAQIEAEPFTLTCCGIGSFARSGIVFAKLGGDTQALQRLHQSVDEALHAVGFDKEAKAYRPHITLARQFRSDDGFEAQVLDDEGCSFAVNHLMLFESRREDGRLVYVPLFKKELNSLNT